MSCHDNVEADGSVHDANRIQFLDEYLGNLQKAADEGAEIAGYFLWTFWTISNGMRAIPNGSELFMWTLQPSSVM